MRQLLTLLLILSASVTTNGQKHIEIPQNEVVRCFVQHIPEKLNKFKLDDLRNSTDSLAIRIWKTNEILTIKANSSTDYEYRLFIDNDKFKLQEKTYFGKLSQAFLDSLNSFKILELENDNFRGIDGSYIFFEISTKTNYKICSFWSPEPKRNANCKSVVQTLDLTNKLLKTETLRTEFIENLEPGTYTWGMANINIDRFLSKQTIKTDFYDSAELKIRKVFNITDKTSHQQYPRIIINDRQAGIADLNKYSEKDVRNFEMLKPDNQTIAIYGLSGSYGIVKIKTKKDCP